jgi:hypothetical protein
MISEHGLAPFSHDEAQPLGPLVQAVCEPLAQEPAPDDEPAPVSLEAETLRSCLLVRGEMLLKPRYLGVIDIEA